MRIRKSTDRRLSEQVGCKQKHIDRLRAELELAYWDLYYLQARAEGLGLEVCELVANQNFCKNPIWYVTPEDEQKIESQIDADIEEAKLKRNVDNDA